MPHCLFFISFFDHQSEGFDLFDRLTQFSPEYFHHIAFFSLVFLDQSEKFDLSDYLGQPLDISGGGGN